MSVRQTALSGETGRSKVVVGNYCLRPDNGGAMPDEDLTFTTHVDPVSPPPISSRVRAGGKGNWWRRRALPPGPSRLFRQAFIVIAGEPALLI